jgi:hypothetical protein
MHTLSKIVLAAGFASANIVTVMPQPLATAADQKPLGDLNSFIAIAKDAQAIAKAGDYKKSRARLKELEKTWDDAEEQFRPNNQDGWRDTDRKLDKTLDKLRDMKPDPKAVGDAFEALIGALEGLNKPK